MSRRKQDLAKRDLYKITTLRHQLASAKIARLMRDLQSAEHKEQAFGEQLARLHHETQLAQSASLSQMTNNLSGIGVYQGILRMLDVEIRRTEVRKDMQADECRMLRGALSSQRKSLERLEIRLDLYKKMLRLVRVMEADGRDDQD